jgi:hypothetical protein
LLKCAIDCLVMLDPIIMFVVCSVCALLFAQVFFLQTHMWIRTERGDS